jgi:CHAT domain-containing protein
LPEAQREAEYLKAKLANAVLLEEDKATLSALLDHLPEATFFYFAGHGLGHGGFGALLVAPEPGDKTEAAFVGADELAKLNLRQLKLAVLASCSSGVGEQSGLVNLDSLARGFLEAGTTRVVAARWNVNSSETASMMTEFYDRLRGQHPAEALRQAELRVRENAAHPYYWAGLQVFGAP